MEMRNLERICIGEDCGKTFVPSAPQQKYCSAKCRTKTHMRVFYRRRLLLYGKTRPGSRIKQKQIRFCFRLGCNNPVVIEEGKAGRPRLYCSERCRELSRRYRLPPQPSVPVVKRVPPSTVAEARRRLHYHLEHCPVQINGVCPAAFLPSRHRCLQFAVLLDDYYQLRGHPRRWTTEEGTWNSAEAAKQGPTTTHKLYEWATSLR